MRFVWEKRQSGDKKKAEPGCLTALFRLAYNAAWLLPIFLTYRGTLDYSTGFALFTAVCIVRLTANLYANNTMSPAQYDAYLFRA